MRMTATLRGGETLLQALQGMAGAAGPTNRRRLYSAAGRYMIAQEIPTIFAESGPGWPKPKYRNGQPLQDTGRLRDSISYRANDRDLVVGTPLAYGGVQQRGGVITPGAGKKFLAIPLSPPLTVSERRQGNPRAFPGAFVLMKGPEGPGIYRLSRIARSVNLKTRKSSYQGASRGIERIFALVRAVRIAPRRYLKWTPRALEHIARLWTQMVAKP